MYFFLFLFFKILNYFFFIYFLFFECTFNTSKLIEVVNFMHILQKI